LRTDGIPAERPTGAGVDPLADPLAVFDLGIAPYGPVQELQGRLRRAVADGVVPGVVLLLEHYPVITLGNRGSPDDLCDLSQIRSIGIEVSPSERGGQATLHAPGQLISYLIVPIPERNLRRFVHDLEEALVVLLGGFGVEAQRREGRPGLYVEGDKIASLGLRCHRWVASHGTSLNISVDLSLFDFIVSCGEPGLRQTSLTALTGLDYGMDLVKERYVEAIARVFGWELTASRTMKYDRVETALGLAGETADSTR
jgi:lipoyl(octanoyl) transferase